MKEILRPAIVVMVLFGAFGAYAASSFEDNSTHIVPSAGVPPGQCPWPQPQEPQPRR
jgi:hypothetical protein